MKSGRRVVLATRNPHKILELKRILGDAGLDVELVGVDAYPDAPEVPETGDTFEANALLKARAVARATGELAVADDSGICVDALNGMPGVLSARWSGNLRDGDDRDGDDRDRDDRDGDDRDRDDRDAVNLRLVLAQVADVPDERRGASFECAAVAVFPDGEELVAHGRIKGTLTRVPRGTGGFGYDPIFLPTGSDRTTAEMAPAEKDAISHRGRAFRALARLLVSAETANEGSRHE